MNREDVKEWHYITLITTVQSIMRHGILSNTLAEQMAHESVAMPEVQEIRKNSRYRELEGCTSMQIYISTRITPCSANADQ